MTIITLHDLTARETDSVLLGTIAGVEYHEMRYVMRKDASGTHQIVGRASDWPLIQLRAENAEQAALLIAATQQAEQADALALAAQSRLSELEAQLAALRAELDQAALIPPALAAAATGLEITPALVEPQLLQCPDCVKQFGSNQALGSHRSRAHGYRAAAVESPTEADWLCATCGKPGTPSINEPARCKRCVRQVALMEPPAPAWHCAECGRAAEPSIGDPTRCKACVRKSMPATSAISTWHCANKGCSGAFAQSLKNAAYCTECAKVQPIGSSNGHEREVGANT